MIFDSTVMSLIEVFCVIIFHQFKIILNIRFYNFGMMKKMLSILLITLFLVSTTELYQFLKLPILAEHYLEHKALNPDMNVTAFLVAHYNHPSKDSDYGKDQKLPFIIHAKPLHLVFTIQQDFRLTINQKTSEPVFSHKMPCKDEDHCYKGFLSSVWEPPRFVLF